MTETWDVHEHVDEDVHEHVDVHEHGDDDGYAGDIGLVNWLCAGLSGRGRSKLPTQIRGEP